MRNWKTTLVGALTGLGYAFLSAISTGVKPKDAAIAVGLAALGAVAKDHNVTGGTVSQ